MLASRGVLLAAGVARQSTIRSSRRLISTTPWPTSRSAVRVPASSILNHTTPSWRYSRTLGAPALFIAPQAQTRLASTSIPAASSSSPGLIDEAAAQATSASSASSTSAFELPGLGETYLTAIPEHIGYLKEMGLDYGWGVTSTLQFALEHVHIYSGMPWWASIVLTSLAVRTCLAPSFKKSNEVATRAAAIAPVTRPLYEKLKLHMTLQETEAAAQVKKEIAEVNKAAGVKMRQMYAPMVYQGVIGFCAFRLMRDMAALPVPGLETGGALWFTDLTLADPYIALSVVTAGLMHLGLRNAINPGQLGVPPAMKYLNNYGMPLMFLIFTCFQPAANVLWMATSALATAFQQMLFRQPALREALGMSPIVPPPATEPSKPKVLDVKANHVSYPGEFRYQPPNIKTAQDFVAGDKSSSQKGFKDRFWDRINSTAEDLREFKNDAVDKAQAWQNSSRKQEHVSKTRDKNYLDRAAAYEAEWRKRNANKPVETKKKSTKQ